MSLTESEALDIIADCTAEIGRLRKVIASARNVIESGSRLRSDPGTHELFLAELTRAVAEVDALSTDSVAPATPSDETEVPTVCDESGVTRTVGKEDTA